MTTMTPPVNAPAAEWTGDPEKRPLTQASLNDDVLKMISLPGPWWWIAFIFDLLVLACALAAVRNLIVHGWGVSGFMRPVMWAVDITNFVFWVGIAHCGTLVSAVHAASHGERRYWVFEELNTKPGVTYLQKVKRDTMGGGHA